MSSARVPFEDVVREHKDAVYRYARALCRNDTLAEDVLQDALIDALRGWNDFRGESSVRTWLFTITRRTAIRVMRHQFAPVDIAEPLPRLARAAGFGWEGDGEAKSPEGLAALDETREMLRRALSTLSTHDQEIIVLRDLEQMTVAESGQLLHLSEEAVRARHHRARLRLMATLLSAELAGRENDHGK